MENVPETMVRMAEELRLPVEGLMQRSLRAFLMQEMRAAQMDVGDLQDRYRAVNATELRAHIAHGEIYSHPAWEDAIEWERLETYIAHLQRLLGEAQDV